MGKLQTRFHIVITSVLWFFTWLAVGFIRFVDRKSVWVNAVTLQKSGTDRPMRLMLLFTLWRLPWWWDLSLSLSPPFLILSFSHSLRLSISPSSFPSLPLSLHISLPLSLSLSLYPPFLVLSFPCSLFRGLLCKLGWIESLEGWSDNMYSMFEQHNGYLSNIHSTSSIP